MHPAVADIQDLVICEISAIWDKVPQTPSLAYRGSGIPEPGTGFLTFSFLVRNEARGPQF